MKYSTKSRAHVHPTLARIVSAIIAAACLELVLNHNCAVAQSPADTPQNSAPDGRRVLRFPTDRAMGVIYWRKGPVEEHDPKWMYGEEWRRVAEARGNVRLPTNGEARLDVNKATSKDLSGLAQLDPELLQAVGFDESEVNDEGLAQLSRLTGLKMLDLRSTPITDIGIAKLANLKKLQRLALSAFRTREKGFGPSDESMKALATLPQLEVLGLRHTKVSDKGLAELAKLKSLRDLAFTDGGITDNGLMVLKQLPNLECLRLGVLMEGANITDEGLKTIGALTNLRELDLGATKITTVDSCICNLLNDCKNCRLITPK